MRILLHFILTALLFNSSAWAISYSGVLVRTEFGDFKINEENLNKEIDLSFASPRLEDIFASLKSKDYVSFEGARNTSLTTLRVDSINYIGLSDLMGTWRGDDKFCYQFRSFTGFIVYPAKGSKCAQSPRTYREYSYTINVVDGGWLILLSSEKSNFVGDLIIRNKKSLEISLYDPNTGATLRTIKLKK